MIPDTKGTSRAVWPLVGQLVKERKRVYQHIQTFYFVTFFLFFLAVFLSSPHFSLLVFFSFSLWPDVSYKVRLLGVWWTCSSLSADLQLDG